MEKAILVAVQEYSGVTFTKVEDALKSYTKKELLDIFLGYEGIIGFTDRILSVMEVIGYNLEDAESDAGNCLKEARYFRNLPETTRGAYAIEVYDLGMKFETDCPDNDCRIYRNVFRMCRELDEQVVLLSGCPRKVIESELKKNYYELEGMYLMNYAVKQYRLQHKQ